MKRYLFLIIPLFFLINIHHAQVAVFKSIPFMDTVSQPGVRKFGLKHSFTGINVPVIFKTVDFNNNVYYGDSVPNLVNSTQNISEIIDINVDCYAISAYNSNDIYVNKYVYPVNENIVSIASVLAPTGSNCNGYLQLNRNQGSSISFSYDPALQYLTSLLIINSIPMPNAAAGNLCSEIYKVSVPYDGVYTHDGYNYNMSIQESFVILMGQYGFPSNTGLNVMVNPYKQTTLAQCDGKARVNVTNASGPLMYSFDNGAYISTDSITNLCEGMHTVKVKQATDSVAKYFIVSNTFNIFNNPNIYGGPVVDTIVYNLTNCNFNYNQPLDSASLVSYNAIDTNTIFLSWNIWQGGVVTTVSDTMSYMYQTGTSMVSLMIMCGNAKMPAASTLKTFRVNDYVSMIQTAVGIKEHNVSTHFELYPNPFSEKLTLKTKNSIDIKTLRVNNLLGEEIDINYRQLEEEIVIATDHLNPGFYIISVTERSGKKSSFKVIKE